MTISLFVTMMTKVPLTREEERKKKMKSEKQTARRLREDGRAKGSLEDNKE